MIRQITSRLANYAQWLRGLPGADRQVRTAIAGDMILYRLSGDLVRAEAVLRRGRQLKIRQALLRTPADKAALLGKGKRRSFVIGVLPRLDYLSRVVEVPPAPADEMSSMIALRAEASVPPGFENAEISYARIGTTHQGLVRCQVYIARRDKVDEQIAALRKTGLVTDYVIPSATVLEAMFAELGNCDLLVVETANGRLETAFREPTGELSVRACDDERRGESVGIPSAVIESLRSLMGRRSREAEPLKVLWIGRNVPQSQNEQFSVEAVTPEAPVGNEEDVALQVAGPAMMRRADQQMLGTANLLPRSIRLKQQREQGLKTAGIGAAMAMAAIGCLHLSLIIRSNMYERRYQEVSHAASNIRRQGEWLGRRREQLTEVRQARHTSTYFYDVLRGLYYATPEGITYSHIDFMPDGRIRLRGQATSMAMPYRLPNELERRGVFRRVLVRDAGQRKHADGTMIEFSIEGQLDVGGGGYEAAID